MNHPDSPNTIIDNLGSWLCAGVMVYALWVLYGWMAVLIASTILMFTSSFGATHWRNKLYGKR